MAASCDNVRKRGSSWTYFIYVTDGDGKRRQLSKGGFSTRREAETVRVEAHAAMGNGTWVRPERITLRQFIVEEWLPTQRPPTLEESTWRSYERYGRLHVVPYIGGLRLQRLRPMDLNGLYRVLLDSGRRPQNMPALPAWLVLATSGARRGEVLGLKWTDLDLDCCWSGDDESRTKAFRHLRTPQPHLP